MTLHPIYRRFMKMPVLDRKTEMELLWEFKQTGSEKAKRTLVEHYMKLVIKIAREAKRLSGAKIDIQDLISVGSIGLVKALEKYDFNKVDAENRPYRLATLAVYWIRAFVHNSVMEDFSVVHKMTMKGSIKKTYFHFNKLTKNYNLPLTDEQVATVANELGVSVEDVRVVERAKVGDLSLDYRVFDEDGPTLQDVIEDGTAVNEEDLVRKVDRQNLWKKFELALQKLGERERYVLLKRTYSDDPETLGEIAKVFGGVTRERVRQIERRADMKLKKHIMEMMNT